LEAFFRELFMKRITIRAELDQTKCVGCSTCIHVCPVSAFRSNPVRPIERTKTPPCSEHCPAGNDVEGFLRLMKEERFEDALSLLQRTNPFPAITGRVCFHPCEEGCNRKDLDSPVSIFQMERRVSEVEPKPSSPSVPRRKEQIAVVGSGPAGLTCSYYLLRQGYGVTLFEAQPLLGGWLRYGIPEYRLPKKILDQEVDKLLSLGLRVKKGVKVGTDISFGELESFDAVFIASGRHRDAKLHVPGEESKDVFPGGGFLNRARGGGFDLLGKRVAVIGGGNSAVDAARVALRLGSKTTLIYRRSRKEMPAYPSEVKEMEEEGGEILFLAAPVRFHLKDERLKSVECVRMELKEAGADGRRRPVPIPGEPFTLETDSVIVAIGEEPDLSYLPAEFGGGNHLLKTDSLGRTHKGKIFAGGDLTCEVGTVPSAIRSGRLASLAIEAYLNSQETFKPPKLEVVTWEQMNPDYFEIQDRPNTPRLPLERATQGFEEIYSGINPEMAAGESQRCMGCASLPLFTKEDCRGCGNCEQRCPARAIQMKPLDEPFMVKVEVSRSDPKTVEELCRRAHLHPKSVVCFCTTTRAEEIGAAILQGAKSPEEISLRTGARTGCSVLCIQPIFRLLEAARVCFTRPPEDDIWYKTIPNIWEISPEILARYDKGGFRFADDLEFYKKLTRS
jgi:NADPH-dependent glutamate synthase beta subunit-like oxidoreductase/ferredoxin